MTVINRGVLLLPLLLLLLQPAQADEESVAAWVCTKQGSTAPTEVDPFGLSDWEPSRRIELFEYRYNCDEVEPYAPPPEGELTCRATYEKNGKVETLWTAQFQRKYCAKRVSNLLNELEAGGLSCVREVMPGGSCTYTLVDEDTPADAAGTANVATNADPALRVDPVPVAATEAAPKPDANPIVPSIPAQPEPVAQPPQPPAKPVISREAAIKNYLMDHVPAEYVAGIMQHIPPKFELFERHKKPVLGFKQYGSQVLIDFADPSISQWDLYKDGNSKDVIITADYVDGSRESNVHFVFIRVDDILYFVGSVIGGKLETDFSGELVVTEYSGIPTTCPPEIVSFRVKLDAERQVSALSDGIVIGRRPNVECRGG